MTKRLTNPQFIIEVGGKWYITTGVLEYDPGEADNDTLRAGVESVRNMFASKAATGTAVLIDVDSLIAAAQTKPRF